MSDEQDNQNQHEVKSETKEELIIKLYKAAFKNNQGEELEKELDRIYHYHRRLVFEEISKYSTDEGVIVNMRERYVPLSVIRRHLVGDD